MLGAKVKKDSTVAALLRAAGVVILGKTNLSEWAACRSAGNATASQGWSAHGGMTFGAYYEKQSPSGSSSGSAVAASIGLALAAIGTEVGEALLLNMSFRFAIILRKCRYYTYSETRTTTSPFPRRLWPCVHLLSWRSFQFSTYAM